MIGSHDVGYAIVEGEVKEGCLWVRTRRGETDRRGGWIDHLINLHQGEEIIVSWLRRSRLCRGNIISKALCLGSKMIESAAAKEKASSAVYVEHVNCMLG